MKNRGKIRCIVERKICEKRRIVKKEQRRQKLLILDAVERL